MTKKDRAEIDRLAEALGKHPGLEEVTHDAAQSLERLLEMPRLVIRSDTLRRLAAAAGTVADLMERLGHTGAAAVAKEDARDARAFADWQDEQDA